MVLIGEAIFGEFVSKVFNDITDISKDKIREATKKRRNKHQSLESQIYNIVVDVLNKITYDTYGNNQDKIYDVAERILKGFKSSENDNKSNIKLGLSDIYENDSENKSIDFMRLIYRELSKENYSELYCEIELLQQEKEGNKTSRIERKVDEIQYRVKETNEILNKIETNNYNSVINQSQIVKKESRTQEYRNRWNANMFLNNFDKRDKNAGVNVKLKDVYLDEHLPHYTWGDNENIFVDLKELLNEYVDDYDENKMLLILGQPGIGKSTLITWITANFNDRINDIFVYKFSSDLGNMDWQSDRISNKILDELGIKRNDLNGKILIFDGFDEVSIENHRRNDILDNLYGDWIYNNAIDDFSLVITCRENYVQRFATLKCKYITLQPWDEMQIESFCYVFQEKTKNNISDITLKKLLINRSILGIPLILYMVLALNISIEKEGSIVDVYDKVFSIEGGIYDRCIDNRRFADEHRIAEVKKQIHQISREIAIWMFENNPDAACIPQKEYEKVCANIMKDIEEKDIEKDFIIGNFFKLKYIEGEETEELYFIHRSIYEYFVSETIYSSIESSIKDLTCENQEKLAANIAVYLKQGEITHTIGEYLQHKIFRLFNKLSQEKKNRFYEWWEETVAKMMDKGMFYYTNKNINCYENVISKECQCFGNLLKILRLLLDTSKKKYILENVDRGILDRYVNNYMIEEKLLEGTNKSGWISDKVIDEFFMTDKTENNEVILQEDSEELPLNTEANIDENMLREEIERTLSCKEANLSRMSLWGIDFRCIDLTEINLTEADLTGVVLERRKLDYINLRGANLRGANLREANLEGGNLKKADLRKVDLRGANLRGANLRGADLRGAIVRGASLEEANLKGAIIDVACVNNLEDRYDLKLTKVSDYLTKKIISYEKYCERKGRYDNL